MEANVPKVDVSTIPNYVAEELAAVTLECVRNYLHRQEGVDSIDGEELEMKKGGQSNQ